jgi:penicillin-binding protein 2
MKETLYILQRKNGSEIDDAVLTMSEKEAAKVEWPLNRSKLQWFWRIMLLAVSILVVRIFFLNVIRGPYYDSLASYNSVRILPLPAPRGLIYDRFGKLLVSNVPSVDLIVIPADFAHNADDAKEKLRHLQSILGFFLENQDDLLAKLSSNSLDPFILKEQLTQDEMLIFASREKDFPGVSLLKEATRNYSDSLIFSHILGYEGKIRKEELANHPEYSITDSIGKQGLEKSYEASLRGVEGAHRIEVDAKGKVQKDLGSTSPVAGSDLVLNIDADLQKKVFDVLQSQLETNGLSRGAVVALDPRNGAVLALVSYPSFDNNLFARGISTQEYQKLANDPASPLFNRAIAGEYPPGSTIKPVLAAAALKEGIIDENTQIESKGGISVGSFSFGDWKVHGFTDVKEAIAVSSDVFFYSIGGGYGAIRGLGMEVMKKYEQYFGLGAKTGIDIGGEADGFLPDSAWKKEKVGERWYVGDDYHASIGQGFVLTTPLQMVNAIATIANGGTLYTPRIVSQIKNADGSTTMVAPSILQSHVMDTHILSVVREGMRQTVSGRNGTAQALKDLPVAVAGKTGTAEFGSNQKTQGWFEAFAPFENPKIAIIVLTEEQEGHGYNAVPITKEILEWYFGEHKQ